jgi:hypothetical protein
MEDLAYIDRQITDVQKGITALASLQGISSAVRKRALELQSRLDKRSRMLDTFINDRKKNRSFLVQYGFSLQEKTGS